MTFRTPYPGYDILSKWDTLSYNDKTREVLRRRLTQVPEPRFLTPGEWRTLVALCNRVIPQEDGDKVPIAHWIDASLAANETSGTRYAGLPPPRGAWQRGLAALDAEAEIHGQAALDRLPPDAQDEVLRAVDRGEVRAAAWEGFPAQRFFRDVALRSIVKIYYAHPKGQSEIGYGGPASIRGYVRLAADRFDSWEAPAGDWSGDER